MPAQPTYRSTQNTTTSSSSFSTLDFTTPADAEDGDLLVAAFQWQGTSTTVRTATLPAGWTAATAQQDDVGASSSTSLLVATKRARGGTETHTITFSGTCNTMCISVSAYEGADTSDPWDAVGTSAQGASATTVVTATVTPTETGGTWYGAWGNRINILDTSVAVTTSTPAPTVRCDDLSANSGTPGSTSGVNLSTWDGSGKHTPLTATTWTVTIGTATTVYCTFLGVLRAAPAFPATRLEQGLEFYLNGAWTDVTGYVYSRDGVQITRGRADEGQQPEPARMRCTLDNRDGRWSPRNPSGAYFGQLGRNTKARYWVKEGGHRLRLSGGDQFSCPDSASLSITSDIDLRADLWLPTWRPEASDFLGLIKGNSYYLYLTASGKLGIGWYDSGGVFDSMKTTMPIPGPTTGRKAVRVTLDVDNGAAGKTAVFYYSSDDTMDGTWTTIETVTESGTTSIRDTANTLGTYMNGPGEINEIRVYDGIAGTKRASPKFTQAGVNGVSSFYDAEGNLWSQVGTARIDNLNYRFWGELSILPVKWDTSGRDIYSPIEAQGVTRRISQGSTPLKSAMRRGIPAIGSDLVAYWPLEDGETATSLEAGIGGVLNGRKIGAVEPAAYSGFVASDSTPQFETGRILLTAPFYANTDEFQVRFIMHVPPSTIPNNTVLMRIRTNGSLGWVDWIYQTGDVVYLQAYTNLGVATTAGSTLDITDQVNGQDTRVSLEFAKNGTGVDIKQVVLPIGESSGFLTTNTLASITLGSCTSIYINPDGADLGDFSIGHVTVEKNITSVFDAAHALERAYLGEMAHDRIERLAEEENGITVNVRGLGEDAEVLGYQGRKDLLTLLREAAEADDGILVEQRDAEALVYRTRESIYNQQARGTINYAAENLRGFEPVDDDQRTRNQITAQRESGTSTTVEDEDSPLSTQDPPNGVGIYDESVTVSVYADEFARHQACWRVAQGTVDETRWPVITVNLAHPDYTGDAALTRQLLTLDCGDRLTVTNPPSWLPPETINQVVQGYSEYIAQFEHTISWNCTPYSPYRAAVFDDHPNTVARYSNENTVTNEALDTTETGVDVAFTAGPIWTVADGSYDIMIGGERMTVTGVSGASSPQTLTVTRSVNGVVKSHASGADVKLFDPVRYALGASPGSGLNADIDEGRLLRGMDYTLPDVVAEYGNGTNSITSTSFAVLPTTPVTAQIYNPHPYSSMLCIVGFGCWANAATNDVRVSLRVKRAEQEYIAAGIGAGASIGYGEIPATLLSTLNHFHAVVTCELEPSPNPYVFQIYAMRAAAAGTQDVRYATIRIVPLRYVEI